MNFTIAALYRFVAIAEPAALRLRLKLVFEQLELCGTLLIAPEGVNGTLAGSETAIDLLIKCLGDEVGLARDEVKFSCAPEKPFKRLKLRLKRELITFKQPKADPTKICGTYIAPKDWNALISDPETVVLDTRNIYETVIGTFAGARDPQIKQFTDFAEYVRQNLDPKQHKKIAMYCTGGIRCEKASAFMKEEGFPEVYHLKGGILKYLEEIPTEESKWQGDCYVFDRRMAVGHGLTTGNFTMCFCCGYPLSAQDKEHAHYEEGVSCKYCHASSSDEDKARFRMRHKQLLNAETIKQTDDHESFF